MIAVKINADKDPKTLEKNGVTGLPTIQFFTPKGKKVHEISGFYDPDQFVAEMKTALKKAK